MAHFDGASQGIAVTTLRAVIGDIILDDVLAKREHINEGLREKLDEVTERWGVKLTAVEIREIVPPREVQDAMTQQMTAERNRRINTQWLTASATPDALTVAVTFREESITQEVLEVQANARGRRPRGRSGI